MRAQVRLAETEADLNGILSLQRACLTPTVDGFVTVQHTPAVLRAMHAMAPSVVAVDRAGSVVAYALTMLREARRLVPVLEPMFALIETLPPGAISALTPDPQWYVMGQIAVSPAHRGTGLFDALYAAHRRHYRPRFDVLVTEIATRNIRSMRAHARVGFRLVCTHRDATDEWALVALDLPEAMAGVED